MKVPIAANLVVVLPQSLDMARWQQLGLMDRDWCLYDRIGPSFERLVLVLNGERAHPEIEAKLIGSAKGRFDVRVIANHDGLAHDSFEAQIPAKVESNLLPGSTIVKTEQLTAGAVAATIRDRLVRNGHNAVLVTRGGYIWSRFAAAEFGPNSDEARDAASAERMLCRSADLLVGTTDEMVNDLCWRYRVEPKRTAVIPNFVMPSGIILPASEREPGLIVTAGALVARKRIGILIQAIAQLDQELRSKVVLEIIGTGPEEPSLRALAAELGATVRFLPPLGHRELRERLGRCLIYAQASELEGHPRAVIDAMGEGAVAVVADSPGLGSLIRTGSTGVLVPSAGPSDFANAFTGLLSDTDWCDLLGGTAARTAAMFYGIDRVVEQELAAYRRVLESAPRAQDAA